MPTYGHPLTRPYGPPAIIETLPTPAGPFGGFTIPDDVSSGTTEQHAQAQVDSIDFVALQQAIQGIGVLSGGQVSSANGADLNLVIAAAAVVTTMSGPIVKAPAGTATVVADVTNPRFVLITTGATGPVITHGTPDPTTPAFPAIPSTQTLLAAIYVAANATTIEPSDIVDKRVFIQASPQLLGFTLNAGSIAANGLSSTGQVLQVDVNQPYGIGLATTGYSFGNQTLSNVGNITNGLSAVNIGSGGSALGRWELTNSLFGVNINTLNGYLLGSDSQPVIAISAAASNPGYKIGAGASSAPDISWLRTGAAAATFTGQMTFATGITMTDGVNIVLGTTTGTQFGTATNQRIGFFGHAAAVQQTQGATVTNNVTSGGSANTIANFTSLSTYSTDAATIRNDIFQLTATLKVVVDALRAYGLLS